MDTLFTDCQRVLGNGAIILSEYETESVFNSFKMLFPIAEWGRVRWEAVEDKYVVKSMQELVGVFKAKNFNIESDINIIWDEAKLPSLKTKLNLALMALDDVLAVSFDTWFINFEKQFVIEFSEGSIIIGFKIS